MKNFASDIWHDQGGASAVEYALIVALMAVVIIIGIQAIGSGVSGKVEGVAEKFT